MRIRSIKPEFFKHEALFEAEKESGLPLRVAFSGLWCASDREGRFKWRPRQLGTDILPYDLMDFSRVLDALRTRGFVVKYRVGDEWFGVIPSFLKHQIVNNRERDSEIPDPSEAQEVDASGTREPRDTHAGTGEGKGKEGKGKEQGTLIGVPSSVWNPSPEQLRLGALFKRKPTTRFNSKELKAWKSITPIDEEDLATVERYYKAHHPPDADYRSRSLETLLNRWNIVVDRARQFKPRSNGSNI